MYQLRIEGGGNDQWGQSLKPAKTTVKKNDFDFNAAVKNLNNKTDENSKLTYGTTMKDNEFKDMLKEPKPEDLANIASKLKEDKNISTLLDRLKQKGSYTLREETPKDTIHIYKPDLDKLKDTNGASIDIHKLPYKFFLIPDGKGEFTMIENPKYDEQMQQLNKPDFRLAIRGKEIPVYKE